MYNILLVILVGYMLRWLGKSVVVYQVERSKSDKELKSRPIFHVGIVSYLGGSTIKYVGWTLLPAYLIYKHIL